MLKHIHGGLLLQPSLPFSSPPTVLPIKTTTCALVHPSSHVAIDRTPCNYDFKRMQRAKHCNIYCLARRRVRYEDEDENEDDEEQSSNGYNSELSLLESYSESARSEALLVRAIVDGQEEEVLIFKGFSSCLSYRTSPDPSRSILPERAVIKSIDRIRGPFDPSNIEYIEKGLTLKDFQRRIEETN
ncbi:hypothetical protein MKW94_025976 [Papaver nudicaule]|uniref:DUF7734 domain-containing protein n=1 Tax=Papaver nudicaule TaxID=74823 RepID=A0AA41VHV9_PAPNU|nr:hypothetical protein [Papaver nudicaule]